jgi:hypothetical protein
MKINDIITEDQINKLKEASRLASELTEKFEKLFEVVNKKKEPEKLVKFEDIIAKCEYPTIEITYSGSQRDYAIKILAISKLMILADYYNDGWVADWDNSDQKKWVVKQIDNSLIVDYYESVNFGFPPFKSKELAQTALDNNREIFEAALK